MSTATTTADGADFYALESLLDDDEQQFLHRVRDFTKTDVEPNVNKHWQRASFPFETLPGFRQLGLAGLPYRGFSCPGRSFVLDGMVVMELARTDPSIATSRGCTAGCRWARFTCAAVRNRSNTTCRQCPASTRSGRSG